jgi:predicted solute-binding protein
MKLLSKEVLQEYGFIENPDKTTIELEVLTRDKIDIVIKQGDFYYSNMGFDYPIKDVTALRKLYKELRREDLKPL